MASIFSFDIVSEYDKAELINVLEQTKREISTRYDLKGTAASIEWGDTDKTSLKITGNNEFQLEAILDIVRKKLAARNQSQKILDLSTKPVTSNMILTQTIKLISGLSQEKAKKITSLIRDEFPKVKTQIQGEVVRVTSAKKDELQAVMQRLNNVDFDFAISYTNYR